MPTRAKQGSVCAKASFILGIAAALWLTWYYTASAATRHSSDAPGSGAQHRALMQSSEREGGRSIMADLDPVRTRLERLPEREMKSFYSRCSEEGISRRLDGGEAIACSIGYDVLLKKHFSGDFERLLDWSRSRRAAETP